MSTEGSPILDCLLQLNKNYGIIGEEIVKALLIQLDQRSDTFLSSVCV